PTRGTHRHHPPLTEETTVTTHHLTELDRERQMGGIGTETFSREIRVIDLSDFDDRREEITEQLWAAATDIGFFQLEGHGISRAETDGAFAMAERLFALPEATKARYPLVKE